MQNLKSRLHLRHWDLPHHFWSGVGLFLLIFGIEQAGLIIFAYGFHYHQPILGWLVELILDALLIYLIFNFKRPQKSIKLVLTDPKTGFKRWFNNLLLFLIASFVYSGLVSNLLRLHLNNHQTSVNQSSILSYFHFGLIPILAIIVSTVIIAPFIEEFCFRVMLIQPELNDANSTRSDHWRLISQIILTTVFFALMHMIAQPYTGHEHIYWFYFGQYFIVGLWLALNYVKFNNYKFNVFLHMSWNALSILVAILSLSLTH